MKESVLTLIVIFSLNLSIYSQVGIGQTPKSGSILDLTNSNNKYLILPVANVDPSTILTDSSAVIYYKGNLYMKTPGGLKVFTPWKWDGDSTHAISSPSTTPVGIGIIPSVSNYSLQVADAGEVTIASNSPAAIVVGDVNGNPSCPHLLIDQNEIMAKSNASLAGTLNIQEEGGDVTIRSTTSDAGTNTVLTTYGSMDAKGKIRENGNDLLPVGAIIMWSGSTVPAGWALCDGGTYTSDAGGSITTPNLMDRFIVGADATNGTGAAVGKYTAFPVCTGGADSVAINENQMPSHFHGVNINTSIDGNHIHPLGTRGFLTDASALGLEYNNGADGSGDDQAAYTQAGGNHDHSVIGNTGLKGNGRYHENRPPYYALAFIMKL